MGFTFSTGGGFNHHHHHHGHHGNHHITTGTWMLDFIKPNMAAARRRYRSLAIFCGLMIPVCMVLFIVLPMVQLGVFSDSLDVSSGFPSLIIIPFIGFGAFGMLTGYFGMRSHKAKLVMDIVTEATSKDKTSIATMTISKHMGENFGFLVVQKLIETQNLNGFRLIGEVGIAREGMKACESDFVTLSAPAAQPVAASPSKPARATKCPNCGAGTRNEKFCRFCGTGL